ncbi:DNA-protecting protein DprA [Candidatus Peregrinibacteria bacterium]|nr:DNA-protecting protein DprA [Candidatus Peregrinibacteria bacterium]
MQNKSTQIWLTDNIFPPLLKETPDPPKCLFCLGQTLNPSDKYFAIVGTRRPSPYGKQMAEDFAFTIAKSGFAIVSGLAYGIDAIAHEAALEAGQKTIAVLGAGLNHITPHCNLDLAKRISKNGSIITEYQHNISPQEFTFPQRNRIIAGMSIATLVIEAPERSGALITARHSLTYNRDTFALPGNINQETSKGGNCLIRDSKAFPVTCVQDIFDFMKFGFGEDKNPQQKIPLPLLEENEEKLYNLLKNSPLSIDQIAAETALPAFRVSTLISMLEIKGLIKIEGSTVRLID